jgi:hypothetical protein
MDKELINRAGDVLSVPRGSWKLTLELAQMSGWEPPGTDFTYSGRMLTAEDAAKLADALERALSDVPNHDAVEHKLVELDLPDDPPEQIARLKETGFISPEATSLKVLPPDVPASPFEMLSGGRKGRLLDFIAFCRKGEFHIN